MSDIVDRILDLMQSRGLMADEDDAKRVIDDLLDAISEPSEAMHHEARDWSYLKYGKPIGRDASDGCWRAMLAALRKEIEDV